MATTAQRTHLGALMIWLIGRSEQIHYVQQRPMRNVGIYEQQLGDLFAAGKTIAMDCSESVVCLCKWAGLQDPTGLDFDGYGGSSAMFAHLMHYTQPARAHVGAIAVFGPGGRQHAAMVLTPGEDPLLFSHGSEQGPVAVRLSAARTWQEPPVTLLDIAHL